MMVVVPFLSVGCWSTETDKILGEDGPNGEIRALQGTATIASERVLQVNDAELSIRKTSREERDTGSGKATELQRIDQTNSTLDTSCSEKHPVSIAESSGHTLVTASAVSTPDLSDNTPAMVDLSNFEATKIMDKRPGPSGVEYKCQFEPRWLAADLVEKVLMGRIRIRILQ